MNGSFVAVLVGAYAALEFGGSALIAVLVGVLVMASLHTGEMLLARVCGFALNWRTPLALVVRDLILPVMFIDALLFDDFVWHGNAMTVREVEETSVS
jgi:ceramide glucosyltransferase